LASPNPRREFKLFASMASMPARVRLLLLGAGALAVAFAAAVLWWPGKWTAEEPLALEDAGIEAWCADGLTPIAGGGCLRAPEHPSGGGTVPLLVYLHGRYSPKTLADELQRQGRVARLGNARGFGVLAVRGLQGECTQPELADAWCWPSNPRVADHGSRFIARIEPAIAAAKERVGAGPTFLLGFSNGAYFATLIATRSLRLFDAVTIAHGGPVPPTRAAGPRPPLLLITADDDPSDGEMQQLHAELGHEKWAHELVSREGGHALPDWDVNMALTFFTRATKERLPLDPPLQPPRVRKKAADDAGAPETEVEDVNPYEPSQPSDG
jgi:predicted esterase